MSSIIVISAIPFEAQETCSVLREHLPCTEYALVGVGPIAAAKSEAVLAEKCKGKIALYIGSCGSFYEFEKPHLVTTQRVHWMPPCIRTGIASAPEHLYQPYDLSIPRLNLPIKTVLTSPSISLVNDFSPTLYQRLPPSSDLVENMELYSCGRGLTQALSLHIILGVTNGVGPEGRKQWAMNSRHVAKMTAEYVRSNISFFVDWVEKYKKYETRERIFNLKTDMTDLT